ncbi:MAG: 4-(cytidine 5'-diphospho)-2-C-methyl-D-erythritol kinase [Nitrospirae bacterium]|nr:4-(cytidine 5'-diphospho)-2-C-methyl-D-erythritol kinase [Nitrospirota bacterium]
MRLTEREIRIGAPAKVNLVLRVLDRRPDGYHNLWSLMQTVGLEDDLRLRLRTDSVGLRLHCDDPALPTDGRNLVSRAVALVLERAGLSAGRKVGFEIHIAKRIPVSAGLGGGSSDAAATIAGLNHLLELGWSAGEMARVGQGLGSDVPFFFFGPSAVVRGRGDEVAPMTLTGKRWVVLVHPGFPIDTRWAYERLSTTRKGIVPLSKALSGIAEKTALSWEDVIPFMENDFEVALAPTHRMLRDIKAELISAGAEAALLSGSGATVFGVFRDEASAVRAQGSVGQARGRRAFAVRGEGDTLSCRADMSQSLRVG